MPIFLGKIAWGCQISWGAKYPVTPAAVRSLASQTPSVSQRLSLLVLALLPHADTENDRLCGAEKGPACETTPASTYSFRKSADSGNKHTHTPSLCDYILYCKRRTREGLGTRLAIMCVRGARSKHDIMCLMHLDTSLDLDIRTVSPLDLVIRAVVKGMSDHPG